MGERAEQCLLILCRKVSCGSLQRGAVRDGELRCNTEIMLPFVIQVSELISKLEDERNQLQEQLERAATREAEVLQQVRSYITLLGIFVLFFRQAVSALTRDISQQVTTIFEATTAPTDGTLRRSCVPPLHAGPVALALLRCYLLVATRSFRQRTAASHVLYATSAAPRVQTAVVS